METYKIGDRVSLQESALSLSYIAGRRTYTNMHAGKTGKVVGFTADGTKLAIEFDTIVFTNHREYRSKHDNGCHGKGKLHYSWYIPQEHVRKFTFMCDLCSDSCDDELLLLL